MAEENVDTSTEGTSEVADTSSKETDVNQSSEVQDSVETQDTQTTEPEESVDWKKRYTDLQADRDRLQQRLGDSSRTEMQKTREQNLYKNREEEKKRLDVGTYMEKHKKPDGTVDVAGGLNAWAQAREDSSSRNLDSKLGPITSQTQYLAWSTAKILKQIAPDIMEKQMQHEKEIKKVLQEVPALRQFPNRLDQAEKIVLSKMSEKDRNSMQKDLTKQIKKSVQQQQGISIPSSKAPTKKDKTWADAYHQQIIEAGRQKTVL